MAVTYYTILTQAGRDAVAAAIQAGQKVNITQMAAGDGGGAAYEPSADQTALRGEQWRGEVGSYTASGAELTLSASLPAAEGSFTIRELGLFLQDGTLFAVCNTPEIRKVLPEEGAVGDLAITMILEVSGTDPAAITVTVDPAAVLASTAYVDEKIQAHAADTSQHLSDGERAAWNAKGTPYHTQLTLTTGGWSGSGPYTQTVTATGITSDLTPVADVVLSSDTAAAKLQLEAWGCVSRMETLNGQVKATCLEKKPGVNLTVQLVGCKGGSV